MVRKSYPTATNISDRQISVLNPKSSMYNSKKPKTVIERNFDDIPSTLQPILVQKMGMNTLTYLKTIDSLMKTTTLFSQNPLFLHSKKQKIHAFYDKFGAMLKNFRAGLA
jgi:hypothetical protein